MSAEKPVTSEGVPQELDLGHVEPPTQDNMNSLDEAMRAAGILDPGEEMPETSAAPLSDEKPADQPPADEPPVDEKPADEKPAEEKAPEPSPEDVARELEQIDLDAIQPPADISPRNLVNFDKLRDVARHFKAQASRAAEMEQQLAEVQKSPVRVPDEVINELTELRAFRALYDTENDPEFREMFDAKLQGIEEDVFSILRKNGLPEDTEKQLRQIGIDKVSPKWWEESVLDKLSFVDKERIRKRLAERADVSESRFKALEEFKSYRDSYAQYREQQQQAQLQQFEQEIFTHVDQMTEKVPWARYQEIPPGAKPDEAKRITEHNKTVEELETRFREALHPQTPQARAEVAAAAVASVKLAESVTDLGSRLQAANERAEKAEKALEAVRAAGKAPSARQGGRKPATESADPNKLSDEDAIEVGLMAAESAMS
jgi:hypothetical protein